MQFLPVVRRELQESVRKPVTSQVSEHVLLAFLLITLLHQQLPCACWAACPLLSQHLLFRAAVFCFGACFPPGVSVHGVGQLCPNHWPILTPSCSDFLSSVLFWASPCPVSLEFKPHIFFFFVFSFNIMFVIWRGWVGKYKRWRFDFWSELWSCVHSSGNLCLSDACGYKALIYHEHNFECSCLERISRTWVIIALHSIGRRFGIHNLLLLLQTAPMPWWWGCNFWIALEYIFQKKNLLIEKYNLLHFERCKNGLPVLLQTVVVYSIKN